MLYFCIHMPSVEVEIIVWRQLSYVFFVRSFDCALFYFCEVNVSVLKERRICIARKIEFLEDNCNEKKN